MQRGSDSVFEHTLYTPMERCKMPFSNWARIGVTLVVQLARLGLDPFAIRKLGDCTMETYLVAPVLLKNAQDL